MTRYPILALTLGACLTASTAIAAPNKVKYADLDLTSEAGKAELDRRIEAVAASICSDVQQTGTRLTTGAARKQCAAEIRAEVLSKLPARG